MTPQERGMQSVMWMQFRYHEVDPDISSKISSFLAANDRASSYPIIDELLPKLWRTSP